MTSFRVLEGDCVEQMRTLEAGSVQTCVTSPPYYGLRDYGHDDQIGLEAAPNAYVEQLVGVFREVRRVLRDDGTLWLNIGDSYASFRDGKVRPDTARGSSTGTLVTSGASNRSAASFAGTSIKHKDLIGIPWMLAFALRSDGWWLRSDIIWHKPNPMPEKVKDRPTSAHEHIFLLAKSQRYFYDAEAIKEDSTPDMQRRAAMGHTRGDGTRDASRGGAATLLGGVVDATGRNKRNVWKVTTQPFPGAHFAVFPPKLIEPCILAGSPESSTVLDPFAGSGTTGLVALRHGREFIGCELNPEYARMARNRIREDAPLFNKEMA